MRATAFLTLGCIFLVAGIPVTAQPKPETKAFEFKGRTDATTVEIRSRITGVLSKVAVEEGATVKPGEVLAEIDSRGAQIEVNIAKGKLASAQAKRRLAEANHSRVKSAFEKGLTGKDQLVQTETELEVAHADFEIAKAELELAELHLSWTRLIAPIEGRIGRLNLTRGNIVQANTDIVTTLVQMDPLYVEFDVDEKTLMKLRWEPDGRKPTVAVGFTHEEGYPHVAELRGPTFVIDPKTETIRFRATLANPKGQFFPGMFARVRVTPQPAK